MDNIAFRYELTGYGWARATLTIDGQEAVATASYLSDALRDFLIMLATITEQWTAIGSCMWYEEPGEFRWFVSRLDGERAEVLLKWTDTFKHGAWQTLLEANCQFPDLVRAVLAGVDEMLAQVGGQEAYTQKWGMRATTPHHGDLPANVIALLRRFLGEAVVE